VVAKIDLSGVGMTSQRTRNRLTDRLRDQGISNEGILDVMASTPRHLFVDEALAHRAYEDTALPIGYSQTLSQPYIVARMTQAILTLGRPKNVLEIGTGSGYQTVILAQLIDEVLTVERISGLLEKAISRFRLLGLSQIRYKYDDGQLGWPEKQPFDAIMVTASPRVVPQELVAQLSPGGCMMVPVGTPGNQELTLIQREENGFRTEVLEKVRFVPLLGGKR